MTETYEIRPVVHSTADLWQVYGVTDGRAVSPPESRQAAIERAYRMNSRWISAGRNKLFAHGELL